MAAVTGRAEGFIRPVRHADLGRSLTAASLIIGAVAAVILAGAVASGKLADSFGRIRALTCGLALYGSALAV